MSAAVVAAVAVSFRAEQASVSCVHERRVLLLLAPPFTTHCAAEPRFDAKKYAP